MSPLGTEGNITSLPDSKNVWGKIHARIIDQRQDMGTDRSCFARHGFTPTIINSSLIQPAIIVDESGMGKR